MVDELMYADKVKTAVKKLMKLGEDETVPQISVADMLNAKGGKEEGDVIAVYYAYGSVVQTDESSIASGGGHCIAASTVCKDLEDLKNDDGVKAVVIRVNSGGGDAYASEQIWHQVSELKAKKPVVISMGDYAASGAYYLSAPASHLLLFSVERTGHGVAERAVAVCLYLVKLNTELLCHKIAVVGEHTKYTDAARQSVRLCHNP